MYSEPSYATELTASASSAQEGVIPAAKWTSSAAVLQFMGVSIQIQISKNLEVNSSFTDSARRSLSKWQELSTILARQA